MNPTEQIGVEATGDTNSALMFADKRIAVTGAGGTVGIELCRQLLDMGVREIRAIDNSESALWELENELGENGLRCYLADICNEGHMHRYFKDIDYVFHAAALKHVPFCETNPGAAVETNIRGSESVISAALNSGVKKVLFTSSDKAVNPTNVMGTTKLMGERIFTAANNLHIRDDATIFASTRFGNVALSNGSVIPRFLKQIKNGRAVTLTDPGMTRFMMSIEHAVRLVIKSMEIMCGGEVFVTPMPVIRIEDIAKVLMEDFGDGKSKIVCTGIRPGEKLYEELVTAEEVPRTYDYGDMFVVLPAFRNIYGKICYDKYTEKGNPLKKEYNSDLEPALSSSEIRGFLSDIGFVESEEISTSTTTNITKFPLDQAS